MKPKIVDPTDIDIYKSIVDHFREVLNCPGHVAFWQEMTDRMNAVDQGNRHMWGWRYLLSVYNGTVKPSQRFIRAALVIAAQMDGASPLAAAAVPFNGLCLPDRVKPGSIILGRSRQCGRVGCPVSFVPVVPNQKYCCQDCGRRERDRRKVTV